MDRQPGQDLHPDGIGGSAPNSSVAVGGPPFLLGAERGAVASFTSNISAMHILRNCSRTSHDFLECLPTTSMVTPGSTPAPEPPPEMLFNGDNLVSVIAYTVLFTLAALGNLTVFLTLFRSRYRKSRVNLFIMHLSVADLIVTFVMMPMEIGWHITVSWTAGDAACRLLMFWRIFGFYLSSFILIIISMDRYFAIVHPLSLSDADKRAKIMLILAWLFSFVASIPQSVIFHVEVHPIWSWFSQCVTFNFFPTPRHELAYNLFNISALYCAPLLVFIVTYSRIVYEITKKSRETRMLVFVTCWTPYFAISAWWWIDKESAMSIDAKIQRGLFIFAVSNSCVNPVIYGMFTRTFVKEFKRRWCSCCCCKPVTHLYRQSTPTAKSSPSKAKLERLLRMESAEDAERRLSNYVRNKHGCADRPRCVAEELLRTALVVGVSSEVLGKSTARIRRQLTPPHIAGLGHTGYRKVFS